MGEIWRKHVSFLCFSFFFLFIIQFDGMQHPDPVGSIRPNANQIKINYDGE